MTDAPLIWKNKTLITIGDIGDALVALESPEEAREFMRVYSANTIHAYQNVGYVSGYYDLATMARIQEWCQAAHPIFGGTIPTAEEAFEMGKRMIAEERT